MTCYAIGDLQGCYREFKLLLERIKFKPDCDQLWLTGDLVNRGPNSLDVLRSLYALRDNLFTVLGNHDLHLLAVAHGHADLKRRDTLQDILKCRESDSLLNWLNHQPLMHYDDKLNIAMVHAGISPRWDLSLSLSYAREAEDQIRNINTSNFFSQMYGNTPSDWHQDLTGMERIRYIVNCFTRIRYCTKQGELELLEKSAPGSQQQDLIPWFDVPTRPPLECTLVFGHWSTLGFFKKDALVCLDSGCLWGGFLTALALTHGSNAYFQPAVQARPLH